MSQITNIKAGGGGGSAVETLTANSGVATAVANNINVLGDGVNITTTASGSTLTIDFIGSSGGITTIDGNSGSVTGSTVSIVTSNSTVQFAGSGTTLTQNFVGDAFNNIIFGSPPPPTSAGGACVGIGINALSALTTGEFSIALGVNAMGIANASNCVCIGDGAGYFLDSNSNGNILIGWSAGQALSQALGPAINNIAIGYAAGTTWIGTESNNICLGSVGVINQNGTITLGTNGTHTSCFIRGIAGVTVTGTAVLVSGGDQLGVAVSSRKYKENIEDMGDISSDILSLRPDTFTLKDHEDKSTQYGLIAEEVAEVFPGLVVNDKEGNPQTVKYHELPALLLNELQKSVDKIAELEARLSSLEAIVNDYN